MCWIEVVMRIKGYRTKLTRAHLERMTLPRRFWNVSYDEVPDSLKGTLGNFIRDLDEMLDGGEGLLFWGPNGVGKTSAAVLVALEVCRRGGTVLFTTSESIRVSSIEATAFDYDQTLLDRAREVELLVIDDLGKEHRGESEYAERLIENLFRMRSAARRSTIVTTNLPLQGNTVKRIAGLLTVYSQSLMEVIRETLYPVEATGINKRVQAAGLLDERLSA